MRPRIACASVCLALGGCQVNVHIPDSTARSIVTGVVVGLVVADAAGYFGRPGEEVEARPWSGPAQPVRRAHEPDPSRAVSEQDCLRPVDPTLGNLKCR